MSRSTTHPKLATIRLHSDELDTSRDSTKQLVQKTIAYLCVSQKRVENTKNKKTAQVPMLSLTHALNAQRSNKTHKQQVKSLCSVITICIT